MNIKREAILWSMMIATAVMLGLIVVSGAIVLAFHQTVLAPLYFVAAPYYQDDYSAEGVDAVRFHPLDPALEQEALQEDSRRAKLGTPMSYPTLQHLPSPTMIRSTPRKQPLSTSTAAAPTRTMFPVQTSTSGPVPTNTLFPAQTNTLVQLPSATATQGSTSTAFPVLTNTPNASNTPFSPSNTPKSPNTQKPPNTPKPPNTQKPPNTPQPPNTQKPPNTPQPPNTQKPPNTPQPHKTKKPHKYLNYQASETLLILAPENGLQIQCNNNPTSCSGGSSAIVQTGYVSKWFKLGLLQSI